MILSHRMSFIKVTSTILVFHKTLFSTFAVLNLDKVKKKFKSPYISLLTNFIVIISVMTICRILFYILNLQYFSTSITEVSIAFLHGIRFDLSALAYINILYFLIYLFPYIHKNNKIFEKALKFLFIITNSIAVIANLVDTIYFRFTAKRTTADIFDYLSVGGDFDKLLPVFIKDFWYLGFILLLIIIILYKFYQIPYFEKYNNISKVRQIIQEIMIFIITIGIGIFFMRGGCQLRPINILSASQYNHSSLSPVVLNTPFAIMQTIGKSELQKLDYYNEEELEKIFSPIHHSTSVNLLPDSIQRRKNIVIIIVESLSQEHLHYYNQESNIDTLAPFLEKICRKSLCFDGAANGKKSIEGIPALLSGIPTLMNKAFISSAYSNNQHHSLANSLKEMGYHTQFFHGGTNGTMGFDSYTKNAGFDQYFGRKEYNNESHYDGTWGIWDELFLQFCAEKISKQQENPFLSVIFTLSSHHPYSIPADYIDRFTKGDLPIHRTIQYADYALKQFFKKIETEKWYRNTLFVITSDHTSETNSKFYGNTNGIYKIPMIFYDSNYDLSKYSNNQIFQQIDLLPTLLAYTKYDKEFIAFGNNKLDTNSLNFSIQYKNPDYQLQIDNYLMIWNTNNIDKIYSTTSEIDNKNELPLDKQISIEMQKFIKAFLQQYNNRMIQNKIHIKNEKQNKN